MHIMYYVQNAECADRTPVKKEGDIMPFNKMLRIHFQKTNRQLKYIE